MDNNSKGTRTRNTILNRVNRLFNEKERLLTLDEIALELGLTKSRITNHFPKKELLILGIYQEYEKQLQALLGSKKPFKETSNFMDLIDYYADIMDLIYEYRFSVSFLFINPLKDEDLTHHINETYKGNKDRIYKLVEYLVQSKWVDTKLLKPEFFDVFLFKYITLMTTWIISYKIYDKDMGYEQVKPLYLKGIISCFEPYLTVMGWGEYEKAIENLESTEQS